MDNRSNFINISMILNIILLLIIYIYHFDLSGDARVRERFLPRTTRTGILGSYIDLLFEIVFIITSSIAL